MKKSVQDRVHFVSRIVRIQHYKTTKPNL